MAGVTTPAPPAFPVHRFTVDQYHRMIETGILNEDDNVELIEGYIVPKMAKGDDHETTVENLNRLLFGLVPGHLSHRCQCALALPDSEPEPDFVICTPPQARGGKHPRPADTFLVFEVSDTRPFTGIGRRNSSSTPGTASRNTGA